jgi:hypothetical protein
MLNRKYDAHTGEWTPMAQLHKSTFEYLKPSETQLQDMACMRTCFARFAAELDQVLPPGPDKTFIFRELRTLGMWVNVALTRHADGAPRESVAAKDDTTG